MGEFVPSLEEMMKAEDLMTDEQREVSARRERELQEKKFEITLAEVCERYPELSEEITTSLKVPQLGEHHNEGPRMDSHLSLILQTLESIKDGQFGEALQDPDLKKAIRDLVVIEDPVNHEQSKINPTFVDYTFFHDIDKKDCLTVKIEGEKKGTEISWEQWQAIEKDGAPYQLGGKPITSISYFHSSEGNIGQHGNKAADMLKDKGLPPEIIVAISKHEVAYQFAKINTATYEEHFVKPGFSEDQQKFILAASYIDTMASLGKNGKPDLHNYQNLVQSRNNFLLIKHYVDGGVVFRDNGLAALKKRDAVLTAEDVEKIIQGEDKYNLTAFGDKLDGLVSDQQISAVEKEQILSIVSSSPKELGKTFGPKMKLIKPLLEQSREE